jgi:hypothetical protein
MTITGETASQPGDLYQRILAALDAASGGVCEHCKTEAFTRQAEAVMAVVEDEAINRMAETFVEETRIRSMDFRDGLSMDLEPSRTLAALWVGAARGMLGDAPNYSETEIDFGLADPPGVEMATRLAGEVERYVFRVQRRGKLTPHQARQAAEARADAAEATLAAARELAEQLVTATHPTIGGTFAAGIGQKFKAILSSSEEAGRDR